LIPTIATVERGLILTRQQPGAMVRSQDAIVALQFWTSPSATKERPCVSTEISPLAAKNRLLELLPAKDRNRLLAACEPVELKPAEVLREPGQRIRHVYFPAGSSISLLAPAAAGATLEVAVIGDEGVLGISVAFGINIGSQRAQVVCAGPAWRIAAPSFCREFERSPRLRRLLSRYVYVVMAQLAQSAVCSNFHGMTARLACRLLIAGDRARSDRLYVTQKAISAMLGVRREGVNLAASLLREQKLIRYTRGQLTIVDRCGLQAAACECYLPASNARLLRYPGITRH
jgi:CRP-like cAMP-binding protein